MTILEPGSAATLHGTAPWFEKPCLHQNEDVRASFTRSLSLQFIHTNNRKLKMYISMLILFKPLLKFSPYIIVLFGAPQVHTTMFLYCLLLVVTKTS